MGAQFEKIPPMVIDRLASKQDDKVLIGIGDLMRGEYRPSEVADRLAELIQNPHSAEVTEKAGDALAERLRGGISFEDAKTVLTTRLGARNDKNAKVFLKMLERLQHRPELKMLAAGMLGSLRGVGLEPETINEVEIALLGRMMDSKESLELRNFIRARFGGERRGRSRIKGAHSEDETLQIDIGAEAGKGGKAAAGEEAGKGKGHAGEEETGVVEVEPGSGRDSAHMGERSDYNTVKVEIEPGAGVCGAPADENENTVCVEVSPYFRSKYPRRDEVVFIKAELEAGEGPAEKKERVVVEAESDSGKSGEDATKPQRVPERKGDSVSKLLIRLKYGDAAQKGKAEEELAKALGSSKNRKEIDGIHAVALGLKEEFPNLYRTVLKAMQRVLPEWDSSKPPIALGPSGGKKPLGDKDPTPLNPFNVSKR